MLLLLRAFLQLPIATDKIDPSVAWANTNSRVNSVVPEPRAAERALLFIPSALPEGIEPADPMIRFRGLAYPVSYERGHP